MNVLASVKSISDYIKKHETLLIAAGVLAVLLVGYNKWINHEADVTLQKAAVAKAQTEAQVAKDKQLAEQTAQQTAQYQKIVDAMTAQNQALLDAISKRQIVVQTQQKVDQQLPEPALANRWSALLHLRAGEIQNTNGTTTVSDTAARTTVETLEQIPALQQDLNDQNEIIKNKDTQITSLSTVTGSMGTQITGLNTEIADQKKQCSAEVSAVKAEARKSKRNWFVGGLVTGGIAAVRILGF